MSIAKILEKIGLLSIYVGFVVLKGLDDDWSVPGMIAALAIFVVAGELLGRLLRNQGILIDTRPDSRTSKPLPVNDSQINLGRIVLTALAGFAAFLHSRSMEWPLDSLLIACIGSVALAWIALTVIASYLRDFGSETPASELSPVEFEPQSERVESQHWPFRVRYVAAFDALIVIPGSAIIPLTSSDPAFTDSLVGWLLIGLGFWAVQAASLWWVARQPGNTLGRW